MTKVSSLRVLSCFLPGFGLRLKKSWGFYKKRESKIILTLSFFFCMEHFLMRQKYGLIIYCLWPYKKAVGTGGHGFCLFIVPCRLSSGLQALIRLLCFGGLGCRDVLFVVEGHVGLQGAFEEGTWKKADMDTLDVIARAVLFL